MNTNKLKKKLEEFFDFSNKKQKKKHDEFLKIIKKLEGKRSKIETELIEEGVRDESSKRYHELSHELKVVNKLIRKANQLVRSS
jgi:wobble nucleotide-excising tRNase